MTTMVFSPRRDIMKSHEEAVSYEEFGRAYTKNDLFNQSFTKPLVTLR